MAPVGARVVPHILGPDIDSKKLPSREVQIVAYIRDFDDSNNQAQVELADGVVIQVHLSPGVELTNTMLLQGQLGWGGELGEAGSWVRRGVG